MMTALPGFSVPMDTLLTSPNGLVAGSEMGGHPLEASVAIAVAVRVGVGCVVAVGSARGG
jgi:hypothetical protein